MDRREEIEEEKGRGRGGRGVIQEDTRTVGLIGAESFVSGLIFSSEVVSWPSLFPSVCRSVRRAAANSPIYPDWATLINFLPKIMASSEESARREKTLRKTFPCVSRMAKKALQPRRNLFLFIVKTLSEK